MRKIPCCAFFLILFSTLQQGTCLSCWSCSSDVEPHFCRDPFNETEIRNREYGYSPQQGQRYPDQNYRNYDQNYNQQGYQQQQQQQQPGYNGQPYGGYSQGNYGAGRLTSQFFTRCNDEEARRTRRRNVCVKKVQRRNVNDIVTVIRRCEMIDMDRAVGTCNDPVDRGVTLDFCEYCDQDGCNAATDIRTSAVLTLLPIAVYWVFRH